jgi:EAL domain-containing protein (putative c-di-GMP-specific phosphodiesterase class I)
MNTVAEGVEDEAQAEFLRRAGATVMQGFLYSPPVPAERAIAALAPASDAPVWIGAVEGKGVPTS